MSTEAIDNLLTNKETTNDPNFVKFFMNFGILTGVIIVFVIIGAIGLYLTKVAESGVLPTNPLGKPYICTGDDLKTAGDYIKMNIVREYGLKGLAILVGMSPINTYAQFAKFDAKSMEKSFKGGYIRSLYDQTVNPDPDNTEWKASNISIWRSDVMNEMVASSFGFFQNVYGAFGVMPEWLTMFLMGLAGFILIPFYMMWNLGTSIWYHFKTLASERVAFSLTDGIDWLKPKTRKENGEPGPWSKPDDSFIANIFPFGQKDLTGDEITDGEKFKKFLLKLLAIIGLAIYFIGSMLFFSPMYLLFYVPYKALFSTKYKLKLEEDFAGDGAARDSGLKTIFTFIKDVFAYKRTYLIVLSIINVFMNANTYLGPNYLVAVVVAVILAIIYCNILVSKKGSDDNTLIRVDPAKLGTQDSEDELEEDDEDDCQTDKALIQKLKESINTLSDEIYKKQGKSVTEIKKSYDFVNEIKEQLGEQPASKPTAEAVDVDELDISVKLPNGDIRLSPTQMAEVKKKEAELNKQVSAINTMISNETAADKKILEKDKNQREEQLVVIKTVLEKEVAPAAILASILKPTSAVAGITKPKEKESSSSSGSFFDRFRKKGNQTYPEMRMSDGANQSGGTNQSGGASVKLTKLPGFDTLNSDLNALIKQFFNSSDFGRKSLILSADDENSVAIQKLQSQKKYLQIYLNTLEFNLKKVKDSQTKFVTALKTLKEPDGISGLTMETKPDSNDNGIPFIQLMNIYRKSERYIYTIRPNIIEIINDFADRQTDLNTNVEQEKTLLQKLSIKKSNPKMNAKYFNDVFPLESNIKQLDTDLFDGVSNVFMDLLVDRDDPPNQKYNRIIDLFIVVIKEKGDKIVKDPMFKKLFEGSVASNNGSSSSIASGATSGDAATATTTAEGAKPLVVENAATTTTTATTAGEGAKPALVPTAAGANSGGKRRSRSNRTNNHVVTEEKQYNIRLV